MAYPVILAEYYRRKRLRHPEPTVIMLVEIMGVEWWIRHGFFREYRVGRWYIDLANPKLQLAIEGDGKQYHMDIVREHDRDQALQRKGWRVCHFRYEDLKYHPEKCKSRIEAAWEDLRPRTMAERKIIHEAMRRSGFRI
jgi:very-short-patch-repair endonuclease